jgi:hypothetical protein
LYTWTAQYEDGTSLSEHENDVEHGTGDIDWERVRAVHLLPLKDGLPIHVVEIHPPDERLIALARRVIAINGSGDAQDKFTIWVVGWQRTDAGKNHKSILFVYPDGSVRMSSEDV